MTFKVILRSSILVAVALMLSAVRAAPVKVLTEAGDDTGLLYAESHALLIGVSDYQQGWPDLPGVKNDMAAVSAALENHGFNVVVVDNPTHEQMVQAYKNFINQYGFSEHNRLLFYFAGHGFTLKRSWGDTMGYIMPSDAPNPNDDQTQFLAKAFDMQQMEVYAKRIEAKHALFLFDSCFSGSLFSLSRAIPENISYKTAKPVRQFITSGSADEQVPDVSIFRQQLIAALEGEADANNDFYVTGIELGEFLQNSVTNYSKGAQHPQYGKIRHAKLDKGDFVFELKRPAASQQLATAATQMQEAPPPVPLQLLQRGSLQVNLASGVGKVFVNDEYIGDASRTQPLNKSQIDAGMVMVHVEAEGFDTVSRQVEIRAGEWSQLLFELVPTPKAEAPEPVAVPEPTPAVAKVIPPAAPAVSKAPIAVPDVYTLTVRSNVRNDQVFIDGEPYGATRLDVELSPGLHTLRVEKNGYAPFESEFDLRSDEVIRVKLGRIQTVETQIVTAPAQPAAAGTNDSTSKRSVAGGDSVYIVIPGDGFNTKKKKPKPAAGSGRATAQVLRKAFAGRVGRAEVSRGPEKLATALQRAQARGLKYVVIPNILHWEDRNSSWSGKNDNVSVRIDTYDVASRQKIRSATINKERKKNFTFGIGGNPTPDDLLPAPVAAYVSALLN